MQHVSIGLGCLLVVLMGALGCDPSCPRAVDPCLDREQNGDEEGVDCGGRCAPCLPEAYTACFPPGPPPDCPAITPRPHYVRADAPDGGDGTEGAPWNRLDQVRGCTDGPASGCVAPGDVVFLSGTFEVFERNLGLQNLHGTACHPIRFFGLSGQPAVFTSAASVPEPEDWVYDEDLSDEAAGVHVYRSARAVPELLSSKTEPLMGFFELDDRLVQLVSYADRAELLAPTGVLTRDTGVACDDPVASSNMTMCGGGNPPCCPAGAVCCDRFEGTRCGVLAAGRVDFVEGGENRCITCDDSECRRYAAPIYVGPGVYYDAAECAALRACEAAGGVCDGQAGDACHALLRLDPTPLQVTMGFDMSPTPGGKALRLMHTRELYMREVSHLEFSHLVFEGFRHFTITGDSHDLEFEDIGFRSSGTLDIRTSYEKARDELTACKGEEMCDENGENCQHERLQSACDDKDPCTIRDRDVCPAACGVCSHEARICGSTFRCVGVAPLERVRARRLTLDNGFPPWLFWSDLKHRPSSHVGLKARTSNGGPAYRQHVTQLHVRWSGNHDGDPRAIPPRCIAIEDSVVRHGWFGVIIGAGDSVFVRHNHVHEVHNDAIRHDSPMVSELHIAHNLITDSFQGMTQIPLGVAARPGTLYIHHNVVDLTRGGGPRIPFRRPPGANGPVELDANPGIIATHSKHGQRTPVNVYNNTFVTENAKGAAVARIVARDFMDVPSLFVNNIVVQEATTPRSSLVVGATTYVDADGRPAEIADGNLYWRPGSQTAPHLDGPLACEPLAEGGADGIFGVVRYGHWADNCDYQAANGTCVLPDQRTLGFATLQRLQCLEHTSPVTERVDGALQPILQALPQAEHPDVQHHPGHAPRGYEGYAVYGDPMLDAAYRPGAPFVEARARVPARMPDSGARFIGACPPSGPCFVGPR